MEDRPFIGMGNNPDGPDLPVGLGAELGREPDALSNYGKLTRAQRAAVVAYVQRGVTGEDALARIARAVRCLKRNDLTEILPR